jgi:hypothetical protein
MISLTLTPCVHLQRAIEVDQATKAMRDAEMEAGGYACTRAAEQETAVGVRPIAEHLCY